VEIALEIVGLVIVVGVVAGMAERLNLSPPLVLVIVGVIVSFIPGVPRVEVNPDLVLFGLLPPLLYSAAIRTSLVDFRANRNAIILLSVGAVARRHRVTARYVQKLFEREGTTFSEYVLGQRLACAEGEVQAPQDAGLPEGALEPACLEQRNTVMRRHRSARRARRGGRV